MELTTEQQENALDEFVATCPLVGVWGKSGQGKTTLIGQLMEVPRYRKMLFIDVDVGAATISHLTTQPELCDYRHPGKAMTSTHARFQWACNQVANAHKVTGIGSVVIEGLAGIYNGIAAELFAELNLDEIKGNKARRCYLPAAAACKSLSVQIANMRGRLAAEGRSAVVVATMTTKKKTDDESDESWYVPGVSDNAADYLQEHMDAFVQIVRHPRNGVKILTDIDDRCDQRKMRHEGATKAVAKLKNPGLADVLQAWANARAEYSQHVQTELAKES